MTAENSPAMESESPDHAGLSGDHLSQGHISFAQSVWQKMHWYNTEYPKLKKQVKTVRDAARRLRDDIMANEGNGLVRWWTRNTNTVLEIRFWNQMYDAADDLAEYCRELCSYIRDEDLAKWLEEQMARIAGRSLETPFFLSLPSHKAEMHRLHAPCNNSLRVPASKMTREPDRVKATLEPLPAVPNTSAQAFTHQSFKPFTKLPVELQLMIWKRAIATPTCAGRLALPSFRETAVKTIPSMTLCQDYGLRSACQLSRREILRA